MTPSSSASPFRFVASQMRPDSRSSLSIFLSPAPASPRVFDVRIEGIIPTDSRTSSIGSHGAITIISARPGVDVGHWVVGTIVEALGGRVGGGDILSGGRRCVGT